MGGVLIIISILIPTLLWANLRTLYVWIALFGLLAFGIIGFIDDYAKVMNKRNLGLTALQPGCAQIQAAASAYQDLLKIRSMEPVFGLATADECIWPADVPDPA